MSDFNKSYRIRTEVGKDTHLNVKLERNYEVLEVMSLKIDQKNAYRFHTSDYGVIAGRVLANGALGIPNAKVSVFIAIDEYDITDPIKAMIYPYNTTKSKDEDGRRYNLLPNEKVNDCHAIVGTFPEKQYMLDNDVILEVFEKYYKFTTKTNHAGDYMIFGVPTGSQTVHVDLDLSDIGILSQKPRDMVYKGYDITQFENASKFKTDTNIDALTQIISQDNMVDVISFWGDENENSIGITRCDIDIQYKFEPTCVFLGSIVSDTSSNGISKKCVPSPKMGAMDEIVAGMGTIEMIRKTPDGTVEEFQIQGTQLINGDGVWCYQIPMNLDYVMTDEYGNMVPTNDPKKGIPTRTKVRFRISMQDFENDNANIYRCKMLVPHNPENENKLDYQFGTLTQEDSFRDLFWNGVYSVKSYIPRIQKGANWKNEKFTGFKRVNYYGDKNPLPYNNIRIRIPFMFTIICALIKLMIKFIKFQNTIVNSLMYLMKAKRGQTPYTLLDGSLCDDNLDNVCIIPGINIEKIVKSGGKLKKGMLARTLELFAMEYTGVSKRFEGEEDDEAVEMVANDTKSIDIDNKRETSDVKISYGSDNKTVTINGIRATSDMDYIIQCIEMNLAQEYRVIQFDFYNDWINGVIYIPRWMRNISKKRTFLWGAISFGGKVRACNNEYKSGNRNIVQQCGLDYNIQPNKHSVTNLIGCGSDKKYTCHKNSNVRKKVGIFQNAGVVYNMLNLKGQYVYYFKPCEKSSESSTTVKLFATDIILLGTLNNCDRWGIPNTLSELQSSSYQLPTNLALTDSDIDGDSYDNSSTLIEFKYSKDQQGKSDSVKVDKFSLTPKALLKRDEDGNYTELSGIDWGYTGPLQMCGVTSTSGMYNPGGHFLGLTCRNSQTTIKTCVNLSRICEHGVWMSQRQELSIPNTTKNTFTNLGTVPSGFISKDEISDTDYRWQFATMNYNKLKTVIDGNTGYPIYDFIGVIPTAFGGDLEGRLTGSYNRKIADTVIEHYYNYDGNDTKYDDYYYRTSSSSKYQYERQIMRTGEWMDNEYWRFRLGLTGTTDTNLRSEKQKKFLKSSNSGGIKNYSFPVYENSYYFYFGLKNGATALDEFKKNYYAVCESTNELTQVDKSINIGNLNVGYDGICTTQGVGSIKFNIIASESTFGSNGIKVTNNTLSDNTTGRVQTILNKTQQVSYSNLVAGTYNLTFECEDGTTTDKDIVVDKISVSARVIGTDFKKDVSGLSNEETISLTRVGTNGCGGYIEINGNNFIYNAGVSGVDENNETTDEETDKYNVFPVGGGYSSSLIIRSNFDGQTFEMTATPANPYVFTCKCGNEEPYNITVEQDPTTKNYLIPVPKCDKTYEVYLITKIVSCKPAINYVSVNATQEWLLGSVTILNASLLDFTYGGVSHRSYLSGLTGNDSNMNSGEGWWSQQIGVMHTQPEHIQWKLKNALFGDKDKNFSVSIIANGGVAPYTDILSGTTEGGTSITELEMSALTAINTPTVNYSVEGRRRSNFGYQVQDVNGQIYPSKPFIFPVIYKPFYMEMGLWYLDGTKQYFLVGSVYNGKTWNYNTDGFNECKLNNFTIPNIGTINDPDETLKINEIDIPNQTGGYAYTGKYHQYNARKVSVNREVLAINHTLYTDTPLNKFDLSIGTNYTDTSGTNYKDMCNASKSGLSLYSFTLTGETINGNYYVRMKLNTTNSDYNMYLISNDESNGYKYPLENGVLKNTEKLHRDLMNNTIKASNFGEGFIDAEGRINVNNAKGSIYYIVTPKVNETSEISNGHELTKIKAISISNTIDLSSLGKFFPLNISGTTKYIVDATANNIKTLSVDFKPDEQSSANFKNKEFTFTFYNITEDGTEVTLQTITSTTNDSSTSLTINLSPYASVLGFDGSDNVGIKYYYEVKSSGVSGPSRYNYGKDSKQLVFQKTIV